MKKFCCIGTHGVGKTTLSYQMAAYYKTMGTHVKLINETARSCPFPLNNQFDAYGAMWIIHTHIKKELEAVARHAQLIISDRSPIDSVIYAKVNGCNYGQQIKSIYRLAEDWMETYDRIYYVRPDGNHPDPDGIRSMDEDFRKKVEDLFDDWMEKCPYSIQSKFFIIKSSKIFNQNLCWSDGRTE